MPCLGFEPAVLLVIAAVKLDDISAREIGRLFAEGIGQRLVSVLIGVHDNRVRISAAPVGPVVFFIQIRDLYRSAVHIDPLREKTQTVVAAVEIDIYHAGLGRVGQPQPLCHLKAIVLAHLRGVPVVGNQRKFGAFVHAQQGIVAAQLQVIGLLGLGPCAVAPPLDRAHAAGVRRPVCLINTIGRLLLCLVLFV